MTRIHRVASERELEKRLDEFVTKGYTIKSQSARSARLKEKDWGSAPVHGFVFFFTLIIAALAISIAEANGGYAWLLAIFANVVYASYSRLTSDEVLITVEPEPEPEPEAEARPVPESESEPAPEADPESAFEPER
jgi:hypothetical protein